MKFAPAGLDRSPVFTWQGPPKHVVPTSGASLHRVRYSSKASTSAPPRHHCPPPSSPEGTSFLSINRSWRAAASCHLRRRRRAIEPASHGQGSACTPTHHAPVHAAQPTNLPSQTKPKPNEKSNQTTPAQCPHHSWKPVLTHQRMTEKS
jgi:hypothetical protein